MFSFSSNLSLALFSENWFFSYLIFSIGCFDKEAIESKIALSFIFNNLRPIFNRLIFQPVNVFTDVKINVSFIPHQYKNSQPIYDLL